MGGFLRAGCLDCPGGGQALHFRPGPMGQILGTEPLLKFLGQRFRLVAGGFGRKCLLETFGRGGIGRRGEAAAGRDDSKHHHCPSDWSPVHERVSLVLLPFGFPAGIGGVSVFSGYRHEGREQRSRAGLSNCPWPKRGWSTTMPICACCRSTRPDLLSGTSRP